MLAIENLSAHYGPLSALSGVTLKLERGARVGIFGHNGAGKTTLLKCIVGAQAASTGTVTFDGAPIAAGNVADTVRSGIAYVPQGHKVFPNLSGASSVGNKVATSQLALPEAACTAVYATSGYAQSARTFAQTPLARDNVFSDGSSQQVAEVTGNVGNGFVASLRVPV